MKKTTNHLKITALYERLSVGDERNGKDESNSIKHQKEHLDAYIAICRFRDIIVLVNGI